MRTADKKPNILLIMTDQHRHDYLSCAGADFVNTPNIDRIARLGMRFTHCFTNSPVCVPARISLASGMRPERLGALNNMANLPVETPTYYRHLRDNGYRVACIGKLDLLKQQFYNGKTGQRPCAYSWGFTDPIEIEGKMHAGRFPTPMGPYGFYLQEKGLYGKFHQDYGTRLRLSWSKDAPLQYRSSVLDAEDFEDAYIGRRAAAWLETIDDDFPWHLFVSFVGPHDPFDPPAEYSERCKNRQVPEAIAETAEGKPNWIRGRQTGCSPDHIRDARRQYCASIELLDDQIGLILNALEKRNQLDDTIIAFASDHGEMLGDLGIFQKSVPCEAAIRVPLIVAGPGIKPGSQSDALCELFDLNPTLIDLAGLPAQPGLQAISLNKVLAGKQPDHRDHIISRMHNFACVRDQQFKYVNNYNDQPELYNLLQDPGEQKNIVLQNQQQAKVMSRHLFTGGH